MLDNKVYVVTHGRYDCYKIKGIFEDENMAKEAINKMASESEFPFDDPKEYDIEDWELVLRPRLTEEE